MASDWWLGTFDGAVTDAIGATVAINTLITTVAGLPDPIAAGTGARAFVTDEIDGLFAIVAVGGGTWHVPVYSDGTNWRVG